MKVFILAVEGNTDYYSDVVSAHRTEEGAEKAKKEAEDSDLAEGELVYGREEDWAEEDAGDDWTVDYSIHEVELED